MSTMTCKHCGYAIHQEPTAEVTGDPEATGFMWIDDCGNDGCHKANDGDGGDHEPTPQ